MAAKDDKSTDTKTQGSEVPGTGGDKQQENEAASTKANASAGTASATKPAPAAGKQQEQVLPSYRYIGKTIKHFDHNSKFYQLVPNSVVRNLPADAAQVKLLIKSGELVKI